MNPIEACSELLLDERLRGAKPVVNMPYNIAYVLSCRLMFGSSKMKSLTIPG